MIPELGHVALILALAAAIVQATIPMYGAHRGDPRLMALNASLQNLVIDLGAADDRVVLLQQDDGRLRLVSEDRSSAGLYDLVFARPSATLAIRGAGGADQVILDSADLGQASLFVEAESIRLDRGERLTTGGSVILRAQAHLGSTEDETVTQAAEIEIDGAVDIGGEFVLDAWVATDVVLSGEVPLAMTDLSVQTRALSWIGPEAVIRAASVEVVALTENRLLVEKAAAGGLVELSSEQVTRAGVAGGASITIEAADSGTDAGMAEPGGLLIEAVDRSRFHAVLDTVDSLRPLSRQALASKASMPASA
jgi:hypothetical protein